MKNFKLILFFILISCQGYNNNNVLIQGSWGVSKKSNVDFTFKGDQIIYFEDPDIYNFSIENKKLTIKQEGELITTYEIIILTKEKLILKTIDGEKLTLVRIN
jgi:hypothetical protein